MTFLLTTWSTAMFPPIDEDESEGCSASLLEDLAMTLGAAAILTIVCALLALYLASPK